MSYNGLRKVLIPTIISVYAKLRLFFHFLSKPSFRIDFIFLYQFSVPFFFSLKFSLEIHIFYKGNKMDQVVH